MFETLETRQFLSTTPTTDAPLVDTSSTPTVATKPVLVVRKSGGDQHDYYVVKMEDCLVTSYQSGN
jgi:hypothetical protein